MTVQETFSMTLAKKEVESPVVSGKKVARTWDFVRRVVDIVSVISRNFVRGGETLVFIQME